jgi:hypothetical protein
MSMISLYSLVWPNYAACRETYMVHSNSQNIVLDHFPEHRQILFGHRYSLVRTERKFFLGTVNIASSSSIQEAKILSFDKKFDLKL